MTFDYYYFEGNAHLFKGIESKIFSKPNNLKHFHLVAYLILFLILNPALSFGQKDFDWENKIPTLTQIPDSLLDEDAVIINYSEKRLIIEEKSYINTIITLRKKIKILTTTGIQDHSFFRIQQSPDMTIETLDARTIKPNGVILDFESSEIKSVESKDQIDGSSKDLFFAIPGIDVGDEVEMICKYQCKNFQTNDFIYFHQSIPVLKSTFSIHAPKNIIIKSNVYSGLELPTVKENISNNIITWSNKNNAKFISGSKANLNSRPHLIYQLDYQNLIRQAFNSTFNNWYHLISYFEKTVFKPKIRNHKKFEIQWESIANGATDKMVLLQNIHSYLNQHIEILPILPYERSKGITYFIENKKADQRTLFKIYFALLKKAKIEAKIAVGQSSNIGPIDLKIPTIAQVTNFLFVIQNEAGITLVSPKEETQKYKLHQLPELLYGTAIYMKSSRKRKRLLKINIPKK